MIISIAIQCYHFFSFVKQNFYLPKPSQRYRSILSASSRSLGLFGREKTYCCRTCFSKVQYKFPIFRPFIFPITIYVNPSIQVHSNNFFSEINLSVVLKFHMQHDQTSGLKNTKIQSGQESKIAADTKNSRTNKINFFFRTSWYILLKFCMAHKWHPWCSEILK